MEAATTLDTSGGRRFGARDESLVRTIPKEQFPPVKVGTARLLAMRQRRTTCRVQRGPDQGARSAPGRQPPWQTRR